MKQGPLGVPRDWLPGRAGCWSPGVSGWGRGGHGGRWARFPGDASRGRPRTGQEAGPRGKARWGAAKDALGAGRRPVGPVPRGIGDGGGSPGTSLSPRGPGFLSRKCRKGTCPGASLGGQADPPHHPAGEQGLGIQDWSPRCWIEWDSFPTHLRLGLCAPVSPGEALT